jgi:hypothetical protein
MFGLCTDSIARLPPEWARRFAVATGPLTVTLGDAEFLDGVDLSLDDWYARLAADPSLPASFAAPSPGQFALAFDDLLARGCAGIVSLHACVPAGTDDVPAWAGTVRSARLAAHRLEVPVRVVELAAAGLGLGCCVWSAAETLAAGAAPDDVVAVAEQTARRTVRFAITAPLEAMRRGAVAGGRDLIAVDRIEWDAEQEVHREIGRVGAVLDAVNAVTAAAVVLGAAAGPRVRVAVAHGHPDTEPIAASLGESAAVESVLRTRVGPVPGTTLGGGEVWCAIVPADLFPGGPFPGGPFPGGPFPADGVPAPAGDGAVSRPDPPTGPAPSIPGAS